MSGCRDVPSILPLLAMDSCRFSATNQAMAGNIANHPATYYYGILRVELVEGGHYYVFYDLEQERGPYYVSLRANSKGSTNPNGATWYENEPLAEFLKQNDPWYRDADTAETSDRPDSNDNSPPPDLCHGS